MANQKGKSAKKSKRQGRGNKSMGFPSRNLQPPHKMVVLPYTNTLTFQEAAVGVGAVYTFSLNSAYDPNVTGAGIQPLGFDEMSQFYGRYRVHRVRIVLEYANVTGVTNPVSAGAYCSPQSTNPANPIAWAVQPTPATVFKQLGPIGSGQDCWTFRMNPNIADVFGLTQREFLDEVEYSANTSSNPIRMAYLHCWVHAIAAAGAVRLTLKMYFDTEFSQPVALSMS